VRRAPIRGEWGEDDEARLSISTLNRARGHPFARYHPALNVVKQTQWTSPQAPRAAIAASTRQVQARVVSTLDTLFSLDLESDARGWLEQFVSRALADAGVWSSPRVSDGVMSYRMVDRASTRMRMNGRIWDIDQKLHPFWLDVERGGAPGAPATWTLYFDIDTASLSPRRARKVLDTIQDPTDIAWVVKLTGSE
jgi:hypothetical protein